MKRVGYWMSEKKSKKLNFEDHVDLFRNAGVELLKIDLEKELEDQGPFDMILHKFTDILVKAQQGHGAEQKIITHIENYINNHPECIIVDPLDGIRKLLDRNEQYNLVLDCNNMNSGSHVFIPTFVDLTSMDVDENRKKLMEADVQYPIVCKPVVAHGTEDCHKMTVIFNDQGLRDISPPCVAQTFVNHNATLYKIFKVGSKQYIGQRPSLKNLYAGKDQSTIYFDTHEVCKMDSSHHLTQLDDSDLKCSPLSPDHAQLEALSETLRKKLGIDLFGVDVIIECDTKKYAVIDINVFPNYDEVDNFFGDLLDHLLFLFNNQQNTHSTNGQQTTPGPKGIHKQQTTGPNGILKQTGRSLSQEFISDDISAKRLKIMDQSDDCGCDSLVYCSRPVSKHDSERRTNGDGIPKTQNDSMNQRIMSAGHNNSKAMIGDRA